MSWLFSSTRVASQTLGTAGLRYASLFVGLVLSAAIARALGPEGRGQYYYPILVVLTLQSFLHLGLEPANFLLLSQRRFSFRELVEQAGMFAMLAGTTGIIIGLTGWLTLQDSLMADVPLVHFALALAPLPLMLHTLYLIGLLLLQGRTVGIQAIVLAASTVQLGAMGVLLLAFADSIAVSAVLAINSLGLTLTWGLTARATAAFAPITPRWHPVLARQALRFGLRVHGGMILFFLGSRLDAYLVKQLLGLTALGYYSLALSLADLVTVATSALTAAVLPRQAHGTLIEAAEITARACRVNLLLATLLVLGLATVAYPLVSFVYGAEFLPSIVPLILLLPGVVMGAISRPLGFYLVRMDRPLLQSVIIGLSAVSGLALCFALISPLGVAGAAIAASVSAGVLMVSQLVWFVRQSGLPLTDVVRLRITEFTGVWTARPERRDPGERAEGSPAATDQRSVWPSP